MKYLRQAKNDIQKSRRNKLIDIWCEKDTLEEFLVEAALKVPDATWAEIHAFKLLKLEKEHPWMRPAYVVIPVVCIALAGIFANYWLSAIVFGIWCLSTVFYLRLESFIEDIERAERVS